MSAAQLAPVAGLPPLPDKVGVWSLAVPPAVVDAEGIFDYMDGAGELYVGFRFELLEAAEYEAEGQPGILVERYRMSTPDDAFGLLSTDWGGEAVDPLDGKPDAAWPPRALYGAGLLRVRSGRVFARVMAERETPAARAAITALGRSVAFHGGAEAPPAMFGALPATFEGGLELQPERSVFLRSHLVLNSAYFLSHANILGLDRGVAAVAAQYRRSAALPSVQVVAVRYPSAAASAAARRAFLREYLRLGEPAESDGAATAAHVEDGWVGVYRAGSLLALAFRCTDGEEARTVAGRAAAALVSKEEHDE